MGRAGVTIFGFFFLRGEREGRKRGVGGGRKRGRGSLSGGKSCVCV